MVSKHSPPNVRELAIETRNAWIQIGTEVQLSTLQFTERLGYKPENAVRMMTIGCYNTLWTLRAHLEQKRDGERDEIDERALRLARKWMGFEEWPDDFESRRDT